MKLEKMSKDEFENELPNKIVNIVEKILDSNNENKAGQTKNTYTKSNA